MNTLLSILFLLAVLAIGLWAAWNIITIIYHTAMITLCAIAYLALTIWEVIVSAINFLIVGPVTGLIRLVR